MAHRMENWDVGDFYVAFHEAAEKSADPKFAEQFRALASAIEPMQREFETESLRCARDTAGLFEHLDWIAAKMGYCEKPRGFEKECDELYARVSEAIAEVKTLRGACFT